VKNGYRKDILQKKLTTKTRNLYGSRQKVKFKFTNKWHFIFFYFQIFSPPDTA
jgi:hypothetical protein